MFHYYFSNSIMMVTMFVIMFGMWISWRHFGHIHQPRLYGRQPVGGSSNDDDECQKQNVFHLRVVRVAGLWVKIWDYLFLYFRYLSRDLNCGNDAIQLPLTCFIMNRIISLFFIMRVILSFIWKRSCFYGELIQWYNRLHYIINGLKQMKSETSFFQTRKYELYCWLANCRTQMSLPDNV